MDEWWFSVRCSTLGMAKRSMHATASETHQRPVGLNDLAMLSFADLTLERIFLKRDED